MRPFRLLLEHPVYWSLNRRNVTRAFALGLFIAFIPIPLQLVVGAMSALLLRLNIPAAITGTLIVNPVTMVPVYLTSYWLGCRLLDLTVRPVTIHMSWEWLTTGLLPIWKPFLLGCLVLGTLTAVMGYILLAGVWHLSLVLKYHRRKGAGASRESADAEK